MNIDLAALEVLPDARRGAPSREWTSEEDAALLKYWPVKRKPDVAKTLGRGEHQCRERYEELTRGK